MAEKGNTYVLDEPTTGLHLRRTGRCRRGWRVVRPVGVPRPDCDRYTQGDTPGIAAIEAAAKPGALTLGNGQSQSR